MKPDPPDETPPDLKALLALAAGAQTKEFNSTADLATQDVEDRKQNRGLRKEIANKLIIILSCELGFLGLMILCQGFQFFGFLLNEWAFSLFTTSVLAQTFLLVRVVVRDLFPAPKKAKKD